MPIEIIELTFDEVDLARRGSSLSPGFSTSDSRSVNPFLRAFCITANNDFNVQ